MTLSKRGDYVVRSALALARAHDADEPRKIREIVAEMGVPQTFASQILADLVRAGLATSKAGKGGGYRLARPPDRITLEEVVEAGEGPLHAARCALGDGPCRWDRVCPLHETWRAATEALRAVLAATTLADLAARDLAIGEGRLAVPEDSHRVGPAALMVDDAVHVERPCRVVSASLAQEHLVSRAVRAGYHQAEELRSRLTDSGPAWAPVEVSTSCAPRRQAGAGRPTEPAGGGELALAFEATGPGGWSSHGELELSVTAVDPERAALHAVGLLRPPPLLETSPVGTRLVQVLGRTTLRHLARAIEETTEETSAGSDGSPHQAGSRAVS